MQQSVAKATAAATARAEQGLQLLLQLHSLPQPMAIDDPTGKQSSWTVHAGIFVSQIALAKREADGLCGQSWGRSQAVFAVQFAY